MMGAKMLLACRFVRRVSAGSFAAGSTRTATTASLAARGYCTSAGPSPRTVRTSEKISDFIGGIFLPFILPGSVYYWLDGKREYPLFHKEKEPELEEPSQHIRGNTAEATVDSEKLSREAVEEVQAEIERMWMSTKSSR